ncbi:AAA family ATPase [Vibrio mediterranei]|uniref:AAA family ATPase n=1 Tax=Vibrio mediterranei TaxID=689 RepID=UPI00148DE342|nr:AAA family ATPase [Vibrio mediterranei]NOI24332.1 AAA family ATPase [Vibrio mediterranei]
MGEPVPINRMSAESTQFSLRTNLTVWVFNVTDEFKQHIVGELSKSINTVVETLSLSLVSQESLSLLHAPDAIFVEAQHGWSSKVAEMQNYTLPFGDLDTSLIVFGDETDSSALRIALRVGASDYLSDNCSMADLLPLLRQIAEQKIVRRKMGELFLFVNTKGGNGASTIAMNVAIELADNYPGEVLLIDIDTQFGLLAEYLDLSPKYGMLDAIDSLSELDEASLGGFVTEYDNKLHTIGFATGQGSAAIDHMEEIQKIVPLFRQFYKYIVIDYSRGIEPAFANLVTPATRVFLVIQQNYMSLKNANQLVRSLKFDFGHDEQSIELIVNRYEKGQSISIKDIENTIPKLDIQLIPNDFKVANESANLGKPVMNFKKRSAISKALQKFSSSLQPAESTNKGWLSKLFK